MAERFPWPPGTSIVQSARAKLNGLTPEPPITGKIDGWLGAMCSPSISLRAALLDTDQCS